MLTDSNTGHPGTMQAINGVNYHVIDVGRGSRTVLLLHGMPDTASVWRHQIDALVDAGYRVIAPDMLGYGRTDKPQNVERYRGHEIVGDIVALLDALQLPQVDLIGHDWGAFVSWELALNVPDRVRRHVALSAGHPDQIARVSSPQAAKESWYMYLNGQADAASLYAAKDGEFFKTVIIASHPEPTEVWSRMKDSEAMNGMLNWDRANPMASFYLAALSGNDAPRLCTIPTLGIWSSGDTYLWEDQISGSSTLMNAQWRYARIEGASHWLMLDRPAEVNTLILEWLRG